MDPSLQGLQGIASSTFMLLLGSAYHAVDKRIDRHVMSLVLEDAFPSNASPISTYVFSHTGFESTMPTVHEERGCSSHRV